MLGLIYNQFSAKPLPLIRKPPKVEFVDDSLIVDIMRQTQTGQKTIPISKVDSQIKQEEIFRPKDTVTSK